MGARSIRTMGGWHGAPASLEEGEDNLRKVLPAFGQAGVRIALENYEAYRTSDLAALVGRIDHPALGICLDLTNSFGALEARMVFWIPSFRLPSAFTSRSLPSRGSSS